MHMLINLTGTFHASRVSARKSPLDSRQAAQSIRVNIRRALEFIMKCIEIPVRKYPVCVTGAGTSSFERYD